MSALLFLARCSFRWTVCRDLRGNGRGAAACGLRSLTRHGVGSAIVARAREAVLRRCKNGSHSSSSVGSLFAFFFFLTGVPSLTGFSSLGVMLMLIDTNFQLLSSVM